MMMISQDYWDEIVSENMETFDLCEADAVRDALEQLEQQQSSADTRSLSLEHLTLTSPLSAEGQRIRKERVEFVQALESLNNDNHRAAAAEALSVLARKLQPIRMENTNESSEHKQQQQQNEQRLMYRYLLVQERGLSYLWKLWTKTIPTITDDTSDASDDVLAMMENLVKIVCWVMGIEDVNDTNNLFVATNKPPPRVLWHALQETIPLAMVAWLQTYRVYLQMMNDSCGDDTATSSQHQQNNSRMLCRLLPIAYWACRQCESNKEEWIKLKQVVHDNDESSPSFITLAQLLVETLQLLKNNNDGNHPNKNGVLVLSDWAARLMTVLCTFDEQRKNNSTAGMTVQASHHSVQALARAGAIAILHANLQHQLQQESQSTGQQKSMVASHLAALRAMAIQDETVQTIANAGVLETARMALVQANHNNQCSSNNNNDDDKDKSSDAAIATSVVGLLRNMCANDDIKSSILTNTNTDLMPAVMTAATQRPQLAALQQHLAGMVAAMALRRPAHAAILIQTWHVHGCILAAMERHASSAVMQRQGALAIRNLVSRCSSEEDIKRRQLVLDAGAERILRQVAAKYVSCQDEVYAALRDLGLPAAQLHVEEITTENGDSKLRVVQSRPMFGERNPNFRPVYD